MLIPTFPNFTRLNLEDKASYEKLVSEFPPHSDISFETLHIWWDLEDRLTVSSLNGNVVINYHLPGDEENSGYCLVGKHSIDASIQMIFDHLRQQHELIRLVHVPEFVVDEIQDKQQFHLKEEADYKEYILDSPALAALAGGDYANTRKKINRFVRGLEGKAVEFKALDVSASASRDQLMATIEGWEKKHPGKNDPHHMVYKALQKTLEHASVLDIQVLGLFIDGQLCAAQFYHRSLDGKYYVLHHLKVDHSFAYIVDYVEHHMAEMAAAKAVPFINMEMDLGIEGLRAHKLGLKPVHFFRKYAITPAE